MVVVLYGLYFFFNLQFLINVAIINILKANRTNNVLQNITHKTKDRETRIPLKPVCYGRVNGSCSTCGTVVIKYVNDLRKDGGVFPTYKSDCHNIREILPKVKLRTGILTMSWG